MKPKHVTAAILLLALVLGVVYLTVRPRASHALQPPDATLTTMADSTCHVGDREYFGLVGFPVTGSQPVHVTRAELTGLPSGLRVAELAAVSVSETKAPILGGAAQADWVGQGYAAMPTHPVTDIVLQPKTTRPAWWLLVKVQVTAAGKQSTTGVKFWYRAGDRHGTATFKYQVGSDCK